MSEDLSEQLGCHTLHVQTEDSQAVEDIAKALNEHGRVHVILPAKNSAGELNPEPFDQVYLMGKTLEVAQNAGIPYPDEWFMVTNITGEGDEKTYCLMGSMGGRLGPIPWGQGGVMSRSRSR